ncbi:hypothetical protein MLD38_012864 [Melastoma candidum]|uniref:Uncharacterized protein n=1 Tax=Melastoma candidum TaxID=119954 RepID=A0ACB9RBC8_9MYRT|nr:hypothetical protein MLD38_012864 [Melastoma candidum]
MGRTVVCHNNDDGASDDGRRTLKISRKLLNGCNVAGKTSVPRKLRTDLKKPSHLTHEDESPEKNIVKKFKRDVVLNSSPGKSFSGPMTKDEQEVVEVLFAMASMFPDSGSNQDAHCRHVSAQTDQLVLSDPMECSIKAEGTKRDSDLSVHSMEKEALSTSVNERKHGEETKSSVPTEELVINKITLQDKQSSEEPAKKEEPSTGSWFRSERSSSKTVGIDSGSCSLFGSQQPAETMQAFNRDAPKCESGLASCSRWQLLYPSFVKGVADKALPAWSIGLQMISNGSCNPQQTSTSKMPAWIDATDHSLKLTCKGANHLKASRNTSTRIPWKRCAAHVGIGYLIQELKGRDTKGSASMQYIHMNPEMDVNMGFRTQASLLKLRTSGLNGVILANAAEGKHEPMFNEFKGCLPCLEMIPKENNLQNLHSMVSKPEQQVYDFLSLSSGKNDIDPNSGGSTARTANMFGMSSYLSTDPVSTQGTHKALPTLNNHYSPHVNQASAAESQQLRLQLPIFLGSSGSTLHRKALVFCRRSSSNCNSRCFGLPRLITRACK